MSESQENNLRLERRMSDNAMIELRTAVEQLTSTTAQGFEKVHRELAQINTAFTVDDLGRPDHNGHRLDHKARMDQAKLLDSYKAEAAKKVVGVATVFLLGLFSSGVVNWIRGHLG